MSNMASIRIVGDILSLNWAERNFNESDCNVCKEEHGNFSDFWIHSDKIENLEDIHNIKEVASELIEYINSILYFEKENYSTIKYDNIKIGNTIYSEVNECLGVQEDCFIIENNKEKELNSAQTEKMKICYRIDSRAKEILRLYQKKGIDFVNLYRICDKLKSFQMDPVKKKWVTAQKYSDFTNSANNPLVSGDEARHGKSMGQPPKNPMTIQEAKQFIDGIIIQFIDEIYNFLSSQGKE